MVEPTTPPDPPQRDWDETDQQWLDALTQRTPAPAHDDPALEAALLREALQADAARVERSAAFQAVTRPELGAERLAKLMNEIDQRGLLQPDRPSFWRSLWSGSRRGWTALAGAGAMAALLGVLVLPPLLAPEPIYDEPPGWRGEAQLIRQAVEQPRQQAEALAQRLKPLGLNPALYQRGRSFFVVGELDAQQASAAAAALRDAGAAATPGLLRWEYTPRP